LTSQEEEEEEELFTKRLQAASNNMACIIAPDMFLMEQLPLFCHSNLSWLA
jgi:hypothetical protein